MQAEQAKLTSDYLKHLTTLSTGSILLITTFLEKLFPHPHWRWAMIAALLGLLISVLGAVAAMTLVLVDVNKPLEGGGTTFAGLTLVLTWTGFCIGIFALTLFAIRNLAI
jgi:hypothetical protein